ncbi:recombinase family protein [Candidatus Gracilibacteria bacterium]|jgi:site-specific DNA recombinase|nr:recombinase family protein [Candidatus Gracilibacteria bacterium]
MEQPKQALNALRYCLYARKSSEDEERQALSIDSQTQEMLAMAERDGLSVVEIKKESHSAKDSGQRPVYNNLIQEIRDGKFNAILTWAPDRLSRNAGDLGGLVDLMDQGKLVEIRTHGQQFSNSPNEKFLLMILCSQAKLENDNRGVNVKRGLKMKAQMGWRPGIAPLGYVNEKTANKGEQRISLDPERAPSIKEMFERVSNHGHSGRMIYHWLNDQIGFRTRSGNRVMLSSIYLMLRNSYYCGKFEYPVKSGRWYKVAHESIISEELFEDAQRQLTVEPKKKHGTKEFHFIKMIKCGACGSGITAEEKFKNLRDGTRRRYVYYHCSQSIDMNCKEPYVREDELTNQLVELIDKIDIDRIGARKRLQEDINRHQKFIEVVLGQTATTIKLPEIDLRSYAKHVLRTGNTEEKREVLGNLNSRLVLKDLRVSIL